MLLCLGAPALAVDTGFADVAENAYYAEAVQYCRENGLIGGTSETAFSPHDATSRAQLATILWRRAGSRAASGNPFSDVPNAAYYAAAAAWANENAFIAGYGDGRLGPNDSVTRAQLVTVLWRMSGSPETVAEASPFADQSAIPAYAADAAIWARSAGIISGKDRNRFDPGGSATRAETAAILYRYLTGSAPDESPDGQAKPDALPKLAIEAGGQTFTATLEDNETTRALLETLPRTVTMSEMNGNEKYYFMPESLPTDAEPPGVIHTGDLMLYGADCIVLFYDTFDSNYSYTRLGALDNAAGLAAAVGHGSIEVTFRAV